MAEKKDPMAFAAIGIGILLDLVGVVGFVVTDMESWTALIPSILGTIMIVAGVLAIQPRFLKHAMHTAALVALLGIFGTARSPLTLLGGEAETPVFFQAATFALCLLFMVLAVISFIQARKRRQASGG
jgi:hypothetical protein